MREVIIENVLDLFEDACISIGRRTNWKMQETLRQLVWWRVLANLDRKRKRAGV